MDYETLRIVASELNELLPGGFINKVHQPLPREIVLRIRVPRDKESKLVISADAKFGRIHLTSLKIPNPARPPRFCAFLRAHFQGAVITEVSMPIPDRVVIISARRGAEGSTLSLILELLGRDSNIILVDKDSGRILDSLLHIPLKETTTRVILPGELYSIPPIPEHRVGEKSVARDRPGIRREEHFGDAPNSRSNQMNQELDQRYSALLGNSLLEALRREVAKPILSRISSLKKRMKKIQSDVHKLTGYRALGDDAEYIKANLGRIKKGMSSVTVQDWESGSPRDIRLNPALDGKENMQFMFRKSAKARRGESVARKRLDLTQEEIRALEDLLYFVEQTSEVEELESFQESSWTDKRRGSKDSALRKDKISPFREFLSPNGHKVFVGKNAMGNDFLLRRKSEKSALWFHAKDYSGSHVIMTKNGTEPFADADIEFASALAIRFSKACGRGKMEVICANRADVDSVKHGVPGQVSIRKHKTLLSNGEIDVPGLD